MSSAPLLRPSPGDGPKLIDARKFLTSRRPEEVGPAGLGRADGRRALEACAAMRCGARCDFEAGQALSVDAGIRGTAPARRNPGRRRHELLPRLWLSRLDEGWLPAQGTEGPQPGRRGGRACRRPSAHHGDPRARLLPADRHRLFRLSVRAADHRREVVPGRLEVRLPSRLAQEFRRLRHQACVAGRRGGIWRRCEGGLIYSRTHFDSMLRDKEEVFRFVWENRDALQIQPGRLRRGPVGTPLAPDRAGRLHPARDDR